MRDDQYLRLQALSEQLTDVFLEEADPEQWPGAGMPLQSMDKATRGDRYWSKKNAAATVMLIGRVENLVGSIQQDSNAGHGASAVTDADEQLDEEIAAAEKEASRLLNKVGEGARKAAFDKRALGNGKA